MTYDLANGPPCTKYGILNNKSGSKIVITVEMYNSESKY